MRTRGKFLNKQTWFSLCSMHTTPDKNCSACKHGQWSNNFKHMISSLIFDYMPEIWLWYVNRRIKPVKFPTIMRVYSKTLASELIHVKAITEPDPNVVVTKIDGDVIHTYPYGLSITYSSKPTVYKEGDYGHSFFYGYYIIDENLKYVYKKTNPDEYMRLCEKYSNK